MTELASNDAKSLEAFINKYNELNNSFKKTCVFTVGHSAGFFSEINNMVFAMLYCLVNEIKFIPYFKSANFSDKKGWLEFFEPFCEEFNFKIPKMWNYRSNDEVERLKKKNPLKFILLKIWSYLFKKKHKISYLTYEIWPKFFNVDFLFREIEVKKLDIEGDLTEACENLVKMIWRLNDETQSEVEKIISKINLPEKYAAIHVRAGDKILEVDKLLEVQEFMKLVFEKCTLRDVFVFADDYRQVEQLIKEYPDYNFYTSCSAEEKGYENAKFQSLNWAEKKKGLLNLFSNINICLNSQLFVGSEHANPDYFIKIIKEDKKSNIIPRKG